MFFFYVITIYFLCLVTFIGNLWFPIFGTYLIFILKFIIVQYVKYFHVSLKNKMRRTFAYFFLNRNRNFLKIMQNSLWI